MTSPRTAAEWAEKCNLDYQTGMNVEGKSWGHLRHGLCEHCANLFADAFARQQVEAFRERAVELVVERAKYYARKHQVHLRDDEESWWRARKIEVESIIAAIRALEP